MMMAGGRFPIPSVNARTRLPDSGTLAAVTGKATRGERAAGYAGGMSSDRPLLDTRRAVRQALRGMRGEAEKLVLVALSGGADSLALAAALAYEAPRAGIRAGALVVDHGLQASSHAVAAAAAAQAEALGLAPVIVRRVTVEAAAGGPEAAARQARYGAFVEAAVAYAASAILTAHTRSDQAEQVLLGLARGSGIRSLAGIPRQRRLTDDCVVIRPFLAPDPEITRETTMAACARLGLAAWQDPHNADPQYARVRARERVLPLLEMELGPGVAAALARTADLAAEDSAALDALAAEAGERARVVDPSDPGLVALDVAALSALPAALRNRVIRQLADTHFAAHLGREHTATVAALVTGWRGQGPITVPGIRVAREGARLIFRANAAAPGSQRLPAE